jgi:hypothetical protein
MKATTWNKGIVLWLSAVALTNIAFLWYSRPFIVQGYGDFMSFYAAGKLVQRGEASRLYDRQAQWDVQQEFTSAVRVRQSALPYIRPPFEALLFFPLAYLSYPAACAVWMGFKIAILFLVLFLLRVCTNLHFDLFSIPAWTVFCLAASPITFDLLLGQDAILLLLVFVSAFVALRRKADFFAGVLLALGLFKFHLVLPLLLIFALRRKSRFVGGFAVVAAILLLVSAALVGWKALLGYPAYLWGLSRDPRSGILPPEIMPNLNGLVTRLADHVGWHGSAHWLGFPIFIGGIVFAAYLWRATDDNDEALLGAGFSLSIVTLLVTSYYLSGYDLVLLILPIVLMGKCLSSCAVKLWALRYFYVCMGILLFIPAYWIITALRRPYWICAILLLLVASIASTLNVCRSSLQSRNG